MTSVIFKRKRVLAAAATVAAATMVLAGCSGGGTDTNPSGSTGAGDNGGASDSIIIGTTDKVTVLDPAGSYDNGSFAVMNQIFPFVLNSPYGTAEVEPDIAESADFSSPKEYTVKLKSGLTFANGHALTSSDVKFSFDRQVKINDPKGPASLLYNLDSVEAPDDLTVVFHLKEGNDQIWPQILSSPAGPIVDEEVFSPDAVTPDTEIVEGNAFAGQYVITNYDFNNAIAYKANPDYKGVLPPAKTANVSVKYYAEASNLKLDVQEGNIDVAWRSLSATDIADLKTKDNVKVVDGPGGEIRYIVFNFNTQPYGATTSDADPAKALAVRQAVADLIDRDAIAKQVYKGTFQALYSYVAAGIPGATEVLKDLYGDGEGGPDAAKAEKTLKDAGVETPIQLNLQYNGDHYGPSSGDEYAMIKNQLETSGLFKVDLQSTEWVQYSKDRVADVYPAYQLGWFPDYSDADTYITPFFLKDNFLANHYDNPAVNDMILKQAVTPDQDARTKLIEEIQAEVAKDLSTVPYLQGSQIAVTGSDISGTKDTLDAAFKFRYGALAKG